MNEKPGDKAPQETIKCEKSHIFAVCLIAFLKKALAFRLTLFQKKQEEVYR